MTSDRLRSRVHSARPLGRARLPFKRMLCNKKSTDGSAKANLIDDPGSEVWGVLYEIASSDLGKLDKIELGYKRVTVNVLTQQNKSVPSETYISNKLTSTHFCYDWYKDLILKGANEHALPANYVEHLKKLPCKPYTKKHSHG